VLETVRVFPSASVSVAEVAGAVSVTLLTEVAVATPREGVVKVGEFAKTKAPLPVSSDITPAS
jgi:membrane-bound lytic murein transglycosylase